MNSITHHTMSYEELQNWLADHYNKSVGIHDLRLYKVAVYDIPEGTKLWSNDSLFEWPVKNAGTQHIALDQCDFLYGGRKAPWWGDR